MMMRIGSRGLVVAALALLAGCKGGLAGDGDETSEALVSSSAALATESEGQALGALAFPGAATPASSVATTLPTAEERAAALKAYIEARLTCADAAQTGGLVNITFTKDCAWAGQRWSGSVEVTYAPTTASAHFELGGVSVNGATFDGDMDVTLVADGHVTVQADWQVMRATGIQVIGQWDTDFTWNDTTYTVVSAHHSLTIDGHTATLTKSNVSWNRDEIAPSSGTVSFTGFQGQNWTLVYSRATDGNIKITITNGRGQSRTITLPGTEEPQNA